MDGWSNDELDAIGGAQEIKIATRRADGSLRRDTTIWVVRLGDGLYVRAAYGPETGWFRRARESRSGRIRAAGVERDIAFADPAPGITDDLHAAYHAKYDQRGARVVATVVSPDAARLTLRLDPR